MGRIHRLRSIITIGEVTAASFFEAASNTSNLDLNGMVPVIDFTWWTDDRPVTPVCSTEASSTSSQMEKLCLLTTNSSTSATSHRESPVTRALPITETRARLSVFSETLGRAHFFLSDLVGAAGRRR